MAAIPHCIGRFFICIVGSPELGVDGKTESREVTE